jgi:hypothetical protein
VDLVFLALRLDALGAFHAEMAPIFNIVQQVLIPVLAILFLVARFVEGSHNHKVLILEVIGAVAVLEALAAGIRAFAGI